MNADTVTSLAMQALTITLEVSMPFLLTGLAVGLVVSVLQAVTSICPCSSLSLVIFASGYSITCPNPLSGMDAHRSAASVFEPASITTCPRTASLTTVATSVAAHSSKPQ